MLLEDDAMTCNVPCVGMTGMVTLQLMENTAAKYNEDASQDKTGIRKENTVILIERIEASKYKRLETLFTAGSVLKEKSTLLVKVTLGAVNGTSINELEDPPAEKFSIDTSHEKRDVGKLKDTLRPDGDGAGDDSVTVTVIPNVPNVEYDALDAFTVDRTNDVTSPMSVVALVTPTDVEEFVEK